jgi:hypothetical protein
MTAGDALLPHFLPPLPSEGNGTSAAPALRRPDVVLFDADSYCGLDLAAALRAPAVARVGTGPRDPYTTPLWAPLYSAGVPAPVTLAQRAANAALIALSRGVISPLLLPRVYSRHRRRVVEAADARLAASAAGDASADLPPPLALPDDDAASTGWSALHRAAWADFTGRRLSGVRADLLWDGQTTLYNSHWGLEYPRPVQPWEHLVGHTTDYHADAAKPLPPPVAAWLAAAPDVPVVLVAMGTLSVLPHWWLASLADAVAGTAATAAATAAAAAQPQQALHARFLWVVPAAQQALLPPAVRAHSDAWWAAAAAASGEPGDGAAPLPFVAAGAVLLADWLPQTAALAQPVVGAFVTHGGMNGVGEGTWARVPLLCVPLFSDQPDNCARIADRGLGRALPPGLTGGGIVAADFRDALAALLDAGGAPYRARLERAWAANVAAGGVPRAVALVEAAAAAGYGGHVAALPPTYFRPWWQAGDADLLLLVAAVVWLAAAAVRAGCRQCCRRRDSPGGKAKRA